MGEYKYLRCRTLVYKFGVLWFWKCDGARKCCGGRERVWEKAYDRAFNHARESIETITYATAEDIQVSVRFINDLERIKEEIGNRTGLDFDELIERSSVGSPAWKHFQEQGEEIVRRVHHRESGEG